MYELIQATPTAYYINYPSRVGIYKINETDICLIDSGNSKAFAKKLLKIISDNGWKIKMILNTHSHADHIGGNHYLQAQTGCKIYAPNIEYCFARHNLLEASLLYAGNPPKDLRHNFLMAEESNVEILTEDVLPCGLEMFSLPGHFFEMVGFKTKDKAVFLADALSSVEIIDKYKIIFLYDVEKYLSTLENISHIDGEIFIPSHVEPCNNIKDLAIYNIKSVHEVVSTILEICKEPICFDYLVKNIFDYYEKYMSFEQYALVGSTLRSYLTYMKNEGLIDSKIENNTVLWCKC